MRKGAGLDDDVMFSTPCERVCATACRGSPDAPEEPEGPPWDLRVDSGEKQVQQLVKTRSYNTSQPKGSGMNA